MCVKMHLNCVHIVVLFILLLMYTSHTFAFKRRRYSVERKSEKRASNSNINANSKSNSGELINSDLLNAMYATSYSTSSSSGCPDGCHCIWKANKKTVECPNLQLTSIPANIDGDVQVFNFSGNPLSHLKRGVFHASGLMHLQRIYLSRCKIMVIENGAFTSVSNVVELDLSHNEISTVATMALKDCPIMSKLYLNNNPITILRNVSFVDLSSLRSLDLSNCLIQVIEANAFEGLKSLRHLHLNGNQLRELSGLIVETLPSLYELNLYSNQWICDCRLRHLKMMMIRQNIPLSTPPSCNAPKRLIDVHWSKLDLDDFACPPIADATIDSVTIYEGENASVDCRVISSPLSTVDWHWKGRVISNVTYMSFGKQMYLIKESVHRDEKFTTLHIINALAKDSGRYTCFASNRAGNVSIDVTLNVAQRKRNNELVTEYSGEEVAGIILGLMFAFLLLFLAVCFFVLRNKETIVTTVLAASDDRQKSRTFSLVNQSNHYSSLERNANAVATNSSDFNCSSRHQMATTVKTTAINLCDDSGQMTGDNDQLMSVIKTYDDQNNLNVSNVHSSDVNVFNNSDNQNQYNVITNNSSTNNNGFNVSSVVNAIPLPCITAGFADELQEVWKYRRRASLGSNTLNNEETEFNASNEQRTNVVSDHNHADAVNCAVFVNQNGYSNYATLRLPQKSLKGVKYNLRPIQASTANNAWIRGVAGSIAALALESSFKGSPDEGLGEEKEYETDILE